MHKQLRKITIVFVLIFALLPFFSFAGTAKQEGPVESAKQASPAESAKQASPAESAKQASFAVPANVGAIYAFAPLDNHVADQQLDVGSTEEKVVLPASLVVTDSNQTEIIITGITWTPDRTFDGTVQGVFVYTPTIPNTYTIEQAADLPLITVQVSKIETTITGLKHKLKKKAGKTLSNTIEITPGYKRTIQLQMYNATTKQWVTKKTIETTADHRSQIKITYPKAWYSRVKTTWRIVADPTESGEGYTGEKIRIKAKRVYQNPKGWLKLKDKKIKLKSNAGYNLTRGIMGLKVSMVQKKLGMGKRKAIMDSATISKVKSWQRKKGLPVTGVVKLRDWKKMGFSEEDWYYKGAYVSPLKTKLTSTRKGCVNAMINNAKRYLGTEFIVGSAGKPGTGIDCSGLVMQSMYAAGVDPKPVSVIRHSKPGYEYESRNLWKDKRLKPVAYKNRKRGDLVFYHKNGVVIHVAIYLGNNKVIESWPNKVVIWPIKNSSRSNIKGIKRVFR